MKRKMIVLQAGFLFAAMLANATSKNDTIRIKVVDSETHSVVLDGSDVPKNCDQSNYDAYCRSSPAERVTVILLVQEGNGTPYRVACSVESKWSRCIRLPKGETFDARKEKRGVTIYYEDDDGKPRKQLYTFVAADTKSETAAPMAAQPAVAQGQNAVRTPAASITTSSTRETVRCSFASIPAGAEVTLDGRYVGSTPSTLGVGIGNHVVVISMPGFSQWKREFAVTSGSELTVNAVLQKVQ